MSDHSLHRYIVTFRYQESGLGDVLSLNSTMTNAGYSTTLNDDEGHPHELGTNSFGVISALDKQEVAAQAAGLAETALETKPDVEVSTLEEFLKAQS